MQEHVGVVIREMSEEIGRKRDGQLAEDSSLLVEGHPEQEGRGSGRAGFAEGTSGGVPLAPGNMVEHLLKRRRA